MPAPLALNVWWTLVAGLIFWVDFLFLFFQLLFSSTEVERGVAIACLDPTYGLTSFGSLDGSGCGCDFFAVPL